MSDTKWFDLHHGRLRPRPRVRAVPVEAPSPEDMARLMQRRREPTAPDISPEEMARLIAIRREEKKNGASG